MDTDKSGQENSQQEKMLFNLNFICNNVVSRPASKELREKQRRGLPKHDSRMQERRKLQHSVPSKKSVSNKKSNVIVATSFFAKKT